MGGGGAGSGAKGAVYTGYIIFPRTGGAGLAVERCAQKKDIPGRQN